MLVQKYGSRESFLTTFTPDYQMQICNDSKLCILGEFPTLAEVKTAYGQNAPVAWMIPQLYSLSEYCGCRDKLQGKPLEECAFVISSEFYNLKVSEIMLFIHMFKSGKYGRFYGSIDPLVITTSLRQFVKDRNKAIDRYAQERKELEDEEAKKDVITWEQFCKETGRNDVHPLARKPEKKEDKKEEIDIDTALSVAESIASNVNGISDSSLAMMRKLFVKKYGCEPEKFISNHKR